MRRFPALLIIAALIAPVVLAFAIARVPAFVVLGLALLAAAGWCRWLEADQERPIRSPAPQAIPHPRT
jgi:hypothetical protein